MMMAISDVFGWLAAACMLATFHAESRERMRWCGLAANVCFIVYGAVQGLLPVVILHLLIFPINAKRLMDYYSASKTSAAAVGSGLSRD